MKIEKTVYLSVDGCNQTGDGSKQRPVATLAQALALSRKIKAPRRIEVSDGLYFRLPDPNGK